jgi:hypothetical protein
MLAWLAHAVLQLSLAMQLKSKHCRMSIAKNESGTTRFLDYPKVLQTQTSGSESKNRKLIP